MSSTSIPSKQKAPLRPKEPGMVPGGQKSTKPTAASTTTSAPKQQKPSTSSSKQSDTKKDTGKSSYTAKDVCEAGIVAFKNEELLRSLKFFSKAIAMENTNVSFYDYRALAYLKLRQYEDALEDGNQMIKIAPKNAKGYLRVGKIFRKLNKSVAAHKIFLLGIKNVFDTDPALKELRTQLKEVEPFVLQQHKVAYTLKGSIPNHSDPNITKAGSSSSSIPFKSAIPYKKPATESVNRAASPETSNSGPVSPGPIYALPFELLVLVFKYLSFHELTRCLRVCKIWHQTLSNFGLLWQHVDLSTSSRSKPINVKTVAALAKRTKTLLQTLVIGQGNYLKDTALKPLIQYGCHHSIRRFEITNNISLSVQGMFDFVKCLRSLTHLNLSETNCVSFYSLSVIIDKSPQLVHLDVSRCQSLQYVEPGTVERVTQMLANKIRPVKHFNVSHSSFNDAILLPFITSCPEMEYLNLESTHVSKTSVLNLQYLPQLTHIILSHNQNGNFNNPATISLADAIVVFSERTTRLQHFELSFCPYLDDHCISFLTTNCGDTLKALIFSNSANVSDASLLVIEETCPNLEELNISRCPRMTLNGFMSLFTALGSDPISRPSPLTKLDISSNSVAVNDALLKLIGTTLPNLTWISLANSNSVTGIGVSGLTDKKYGKGLEWLDLNGCTRVRAEVVNALRRSKSFKGKVTALMNPV